MIQKHKKTILWLSIMVTILIVLIIAFVLIFDIRTIYNDYDDKMILDADFYSPGYEDNIIDSINYFDHLKNEIILLNGKEMKMRKVYFQK